MPTQISQSLHSSSSPIPESKLQEICQKSCENCIQETAYSHEKSQIWANDIIRQILDQLKQQTKGFKFIVYASLIDQLSNGPQGIRTLSGGYFDSDKDGIWNYKWSGKGTDAIISISWIHSQ